MSEEKSHEQRKQEFFQQVRDRQRERRAPYVQQKSTENLEAARKRLNAESTKQKEKQQ